MQTGQILRSITGLVVAAIIVSACGGSSPSPSHIPSTATSSGTPIPTVSGTAGQAALAPGYQMYKGNPGRTGELVGPGPSEPVATLWTVQTAGPIKSSPAVVGDDMFIVSGDGHVVSLDAADGAQRWSSADAGYVGTVTASPAQIFAVGTDGSLTALAIADGKSSWHVAGSVLPNHNPLLVNGLVIAGGGDKRLHAYDAATGAERWSAATGGDIARGASTAGGVIFVGSDDGYLHAIDAATGAELWSHHSARPNFTTTAVRAGTVYASVANGFESAQVLAVDARSGDERWTFTAPNGLGLRSPVVDDQGVYVGADGGPVFALSLADGSIRWTFDGTSETEAPISIVGDTLYLFGSDNAVHAVDRTTGHERWQLGLGAGEDVAAGTTVVGGRILAGTASGKIVAIGSSSLAAASASPAASTAASPSQAPLVPVGELAGAPGGLDDPLDVAIDPKGNEWVVETADRFAIFSPRGAFIERWGSSGSANSQFAFTAHVGDAAGSLVFDKSGGFYVNDPGNYRIQQFDSSRKWIANIGSFGNGDGQFIDPYGMAIGPDGDLYVADYTRADIQVFHPDGTFVRKIGAPGSGPGSLENPIGPAIVEDKLFVADGNVGRGVKEFKTDGTYVQKIAQFPAMGNVGELNVGPDGLLYEADWDGKIQVIDPAAGTLTATWRVGPGWPDSTVQGLTVAKDGRLYVAEWKFGKVEIFEPPKS